MAVGLEGPAAGPEDGCSPWLCEVPKPDFEEVAWASRTPSTGSGAEDDPACLKLPFEVDADEDADVLRRPSLPAELREALYALADDTDHIVAERLQAMPGFDENVASGLELRIGPGPWHISRLEELLEVLLARSTDTFVEEVIPVGTPTSKRRRSSVVASDWRDFGLQQLEDAIESALAADADDTPESAHPLDMEADEPESIHPQEAEDAEAGICQLEGSIMDCIVMPLCERSADGLEEEPALRELPAVVRELTGLLQRTWRLAHVRGRQKAQLRRSLLLARADARAQAERAARAEADRSAAETEAHEHVEATAAKTESLREALRKSQAEALEARQRAEQLERSSWAQAERIRQLEARARCDAERQARARSDTERRAADPESSTAAAAAGCAGAEAAQPQLDEGVALAKELEVLRQQGQELRQRLSTAELELSAVREELGAAELRGQEVRAHGERRVAELEAQLAESQQLAKEAEQRFRTQLQVSQAVAAAGSNAGPGPALAARGGRIGGPGDPGFRLRGSLPRPAHGTLSEELQAHRRGRRHSDLPSHGSGGQGAAASGGKAAGKVPADLRSLGKLLAGGIIRS
uniref:Uncharacterized protein n=1 Tax=Alexandrium monilatum TaxID=311494 RepID=A0A7S4Q6A0_9DINO